MHGPADRGEVSDPVEALTWALIDTGGQMSSIVAHMMQSTPSGDISTETGPFQILHNLLSETFAARGDRPSMRDMNTAVRVILWAADVTAEEIFLVPHGELDELAHTDHSDCLLPPREGHRRPRPRRPR